MAGVGLVIIYSIIALSDFQLCRFDGIHRPYLEWNAYHSSSGFYLGQIEKKEKHTCQYLHTGITQQNWHWLFYQSVLPDRGNFDVQQCQVN